jgi:hypothetical protein
MLDSMKKPELRGIYLLLLARFFLRLPFHLSLGPEIVACPNYSVSTCAGSWKVPSVLFSEKAKGHSF